MKQMVCSLPVLLTAAALLIAGCANPAKTNKPADSSSAAAAGSDTASVDSSEEGGDYSSASATTAAPTQPVPSDANTSIPQSGTIEQSLIYKSVGSRMLELEFLPPTKAVYEKAPVYFIICGGGWSSCSTEAMINFSLHSVQGLRSMGFAVVSVDYRLVGEGAVMDDMVSDVMDAARYLAKHAQTLNIDTGRIVTSGHSAGAQLALMMAYAPHELFTRDSPFTAYDFTVIGTASLSAPTILYLDDEGTFSCSFTTHHLFACKNANSEEARRGSPLTYIRSDSVPTLLLAGTADNMVYPENSILFYEACQKVGAPCQLVLSENGGHSFEAIDTSRPAAPNSIEVQNEIIRFAEALVTQ